MSSRESAFMSGIMWAVYSDMEEEFLEFLEHVPLVEGHRKVYSHKLLQLILKIGGYIDTAFKELAFEHKDKKCREISEKAAKGETVNITLAREALEPIYSLSTKLVSVKSPQYSTPVLIERFVPFIEFKKGKSPKWWKVYNDVKHDWVQNLDKANIENTLRALAGAFVLNIAHEVGIRRLVKFGIVKTRPLTGGRLLLIMTELFWSYILKEPERDHDLQQFF